MTVLECYQYVQDRLNSLSTNAGDNIPKHIFVRTFNTQQDIWVEDRFKLAETNDIRSDEIQHLLLSISTPLLKKEGYWEVALPVDYYHSKRAMALTPCEVFLYRKQESNINRLLSDENWTPSLEWQESFYTIVGGKVRIYGDFNINSLEFLYYRKPAKINMNDGYTDNLGVLNIDIDPELDNSSLIEILNQTILLLASDSADQFRTQTLGNQIAQHT